MLLQGCFIFKFLAYVFEGFSTHKIENVVVYSVIFKVPVGLDNAWYTNMSFMLRFTHCFESTT